MATSNKTVHSQFIYDHVRTALSRHNIKLPQTLNKRSYTARAIEQFEALVDELGITPDILPTIIRKLIDSAPKRKLRSSGAFTLLSRSCILYAIEEFDKSCMLNNYMIQSLVTEKERVDSADDIDKMIAEGRITKEFMALSKRCRRRISDSDQIRELAKLNIHLISGIGPRLAPIFGDDLFLQVE